MHEVLVNRLGGLSLPRKSVVRLTDRTDITLDVYRGRKTTIQQQQQQPSGLRPKFIMKVGVWPQTLRFFINEMTLMRRYDVCFYREIRKKSQSNPSEPATFVQRLPNVFQTPWTFGTRWVAVVQTLLVHWNVNPLIFKYLCIIIILLTISNLSLKYECRRQYFANYFQCEYDI